MSWNVMEKYNDKEDFRFGKKMGMRGHLSMLEKVVNEIYECGMEEGYHKAQEESESFGMSSYKRYR